MKRKKLRKLIQKEVKRQVQDTLDPEPLCQNCKHARVRLNLRCERIPSKFRPVSIKDWCMFWEAE